MIYGIDPRQVVFTNQARCRDCYRCVRVCPVKAIRIEAGQAFVDGTRCISCGTCVRECPQGAKTYRRDITRAREAVARAPVAAVSLAPAFAGAFEAWQYARLPAALRRLGFKHVAETAVGAYKIACASTPYILDPKHSSICTACPAVVNYIEKYDHARVERLMPVVSPMIAHARHLRQKFGPAAAVVFIGPCVAKKMEADRHEHAGLVDAALTFDELREWFKDAGIDLATCEESSFDETPAGRSRLFPVEGGAIATSAMATDVLDDRLIFVSGFDEIRNALEAMSKLEKGCIIEPLLCPHGCVNGPGMEKGGNVYDRRARVIEYARLAKPAAPGPEAALDLKTVFKAQTPGSGIEPDLNQVRAVLEKTGKGRDEDQLNCGACGYVSCRDQAAAVVLGMAETDMCIPYMRRVAEQRSDRIMATSPNAIVILDGALQVLSSNPAFMRLFRTSDACVGKSISAFVDPDPFEKVVSGQVEMFDGIYAHKTIGRVIRQLVYALKAERQYVGIFIDMTPDAASAARLEKLQDETVAQAEELHQHQIEMARNFAKFLGEYTAKGEQLVTKLLEAVKEEPSLKDPAKPAP